MVSVFERVICKDRQVSQGTPAEASEIKSYISMIYDLLRAGHDLCVKMEQRRLFLEGTMTDQQKTQAFALIALTLSMIILVA